MPISNAPIPAVAIIATIDIGNTVTTENINSYSKIVINFAQNILTGLNGSVNKNSLSLLKYIILTYANSPKTNVKS